MQQGERPGVSVRHRHGQYRHNRDEQRGPEHDWTARRSRLTARCLRSGDPVESRARRAGRAPMPSLHVKICGITNAADAELAVEAGATALGFVFYRQSPRAIEPEAAKRIIAALPPFILPVGVFVNEDAKRVRDIMDACGLALAQLHGDETAAYCEGLGRPVLRALRLRTPADLLALAE